MQNNFNKSTYICIKLIQKGWILWFWFTEVDILALFWCRHNNKPKNSDFFLGGGGGEIVPRNVRVGVNLRQNSYFYTEWSLVLHMLYTVEEQVFIVSQCVQHGTWLS